MIVYKVVEKNTRHCSNWAMMKHYQYDASIPKSFINFKKKHPDFFPRYLKGKTIKKVSESVGIFCFKDIDDAEVFINKGFGYNSKAIIIKVRGNGKIVHRPKIITGCGTSPSDLLLYKNKIYQEDGVQGSIAFPSVTVLE